MPDRLRFLGDSLLWVLLGILAAAFGWRTADRIREAMEP